MVVARTLVVTCVASRRSSMFEIVTSEFVMMTAALVAFGTSAPPRNQRYVNELTFTGVTLNWRAPVCGTSA
jgi:hypothetical protein